jgi:hypothetical protein
MNAVATYCPACPFTDGKIFRLNPEIAECVISQSHFFRIRGQTEYFMRVAPIGLRSAVSGDPDHVAEESIPAYDDIAPYFEIKSTRLNPKIWFTKWNPLKFFRIELSPRSIRRRKLPSERRRSGQHTDCL